MKIKTRVLTVAFAMSGAAMVQAQPDVGNQPKGANPPIALPFPGGADWQKMTPEQRREAVQKMVEQTLRASLGMLNYNDKALQDAVVDFAYQQEKSLEPVREAHRKVSQALINNAIADQEITLLMADLKAAETKARTRRKEALVDLDAEIGFTKKPRLAAFLSLMGFTGDETGFIGGVMGAFFGTLSNAGAGAPPANATAITGEFSNDLCKILAGSAQFRRGFARFSRR